MNGKLLLFFLLAAGVATAASLAQINDTKITKLASESPVVLLNFWATWCKPCNAEITALNRLHAKYPTVRFVGINVDEPENSGALPGFLRKHPIQYEIVLRRGTNFEAMATSIDPQWKGGIPATFLFVGGHRVFSKLMMIDERELDRALQNAVK